MSKGGNYLLNVGPDALGVIPQPSQDILREVGKWLAVNGESIYGAGPTPFGAELGSTAWRCTTKPGFLYIHLFNWPGSRLELTDVPAVEEIRLLADPKTTLPFDQDGGMLSVDLPKEPDDSVDTVLRLTLRQ